MARSSLFLLLPLSLLAACGSDNNLNTTHDVAGAEGPDIKVSPATLEFGELGVGEAVTKTFHVKNVGPAESVLDVSEIKIGGEATGFTIVTDETAFTLAGGESRDIDVVFTPLGPGESTAEAIVVSDDEDEAHVTVDLLGEGVGVMPELQITPDPLDFGQLGIDCFKLENLTLTNVGTGDLVIDSIELDGDDAFMLYDSNDLPLTLEPGETTTTGVYFQPSEEGDFESHLTVTSNEPLGTRTATQTGEGVSGADYEDIFEVPTDPPADILFFVDQSCSMDDDAQALGDNFSAFIDQLSTYTTDWHVMVANDDDGCNNSGVLTSASADYETRFEVAAASGGNGFYTEAGLTVAEHAIDKTDAGECNANFLRPTALLHIIMVSDEPEQSELFGGYDSSHVDQVIAKKGDAALVKFSAVAGDYPSGCTSAGNSAEYGSGYYEAASATGGLFLSLCSNWSTFVEDLADASVSMSTFLLEHEPVESTIRVYVNGTERTGGWSYVTYNNTVVFDEARMPEEGDTVTITYEGVATCD